MKKLEEYIETLVLKNLSKKTIASYASAIRRASDKIGKSPEFITETDLRSYLLKYNKLSSSTRKGIINAFKSFYSIALDKEFNKKIVPSPKVEQKQPDVLSVEEMQNILNTTSNVKHKAIIAIMYSCALRVSEVVKLKIKDIDSKNKKINIRNGKGGIDRVVMLDDKLLKMLRVYWGAYQTKTFLFEGAKGGQFSVESIQHLVRRSAKKAGINKKISSHSLRHSCLTQLVKDGVDLRTVQKIAGHKNINTTAAYIHLADADILDTESPISKLKI